MLFAYKDMNDFVPFKITGVVKEDSTGRLLQGVHVFHIKGVDESFTNERGEFVVYTWQQIPIAITAEHPFYYDTTYIISDIQTGITITLKRK